MKEVIKVVMCGIPIMEIKSIKRKIKINKRRFYKEVYCIEESPHFKAFKELKEKV